MDIYRVTFVGQGVIGDEELLKEVLERHIARLIQEKEFVEFSVTRENHFDAIATSAVRSVQNAHGAHNSLLLLSLPHEYEKEDFAKTYDEVVYSLPMEDDKSRTVQNNRRAMVAQSQLVIGYAHEASGEAYHALEYAKRHGKTVQNLADEIPDNEPQITRRIPHPFRFTLR